MQNNEAQVKGQPQHLEGVVPVSSACLVPSVVYFNEDVLFCEMFSSFVKKNCPKKRRQSIIWPVFS